ncbi:MAG: hypothetical protein U5Q03_02630 [Bacteroidota bacterium]|nr:hypothetical protein [Bacteroidota bacterium]
MSIQYPFKKGSARDIVLKYYEIVPSDFNWELYNVAFRGRASACGINDYGKNVCQWGIAPEIAIFRRYFTC